MDDVKRISFVRWLGCIEVWLYEGRCTLLGRVMVFTTISNRTNYPIELEGEGRRGKFKRVLRRNIDSIHSFLRNTYE